MIKSKNYKFTFSFEGNNFCKRIIAETPHEAKEKMKTWIHAISTAEFAGESGEWVKIASTHADDALILGKYRNIIKVIILWEKVVKFFSKKT